MRGQISVLVVEDSPDEAALARMALSAVVPDIQITQASDGDRAIRALGLEGKPVDLPDIVLLDLSLPGLDGFDVLARIRASDRTASLPVVITTNSNDSQDRERADALGCSDYCIKPDSLHELRTQVQEILDRWVPCSDVA